MLLIKSDDELRDLKHYLDENITTSYFPTKYNKPLLNKIKYSASQKNIAAHRIQDFWHKKKIKQALFTNSYFTYLSLPHSDDEAYSLSALMFGKHVAELQPTSKHRINNPYILKNATYHRWDDLSGELVNKLISEFNIDPIERCKYKTFIPITFLQNTPIREICPDVQIFEHQDYTVGFVALPEHPYYHLQIIHLLRAAGLIASPWDIATNIKYKDDVVLLNKQTRRDITLPQTPQQLIKSNIYSKLSFICMQPHLPTQKLAICLQKMLQNLPKNIKPKAVQRIACITDITNTFYKYDYPKFAFCIYVTIHEISLSLYDQQDVIELNHAFNSFLIDAKHTLNKALSINSHELNKSTFIACPATSGTNAYFLAMKLALKMKTSSGKEPIINLITPTYFEFDFEFLNKKSNKFFTNIFEYADIYVLSAGPIVGPEGVTPGTDLNKFISNISTVIRKKAITLIVDTTTAMYKNLHLDPHLQQFIREGRLSIIFNESHQKFGMIHTDQAQYGRMFAICSNEQFDSDVINEMQANAKEDFRVHLDLRVGAYINSICGETLEDIKEQHFKNGALLRKILIQTSWASAHVVTHQHMLSNIDELYFVTALSTASANNIETRDSFGHFNIVLGSVATIKRVSADASDKLDCLIQAAQISLDHFCPKKILNKLTSSVKKSNDLSAAEQIISTALAANILNSLNTLEQSDFLPLLFVLKNIIIQCPLLKGRQHHNQMRTAYYELHKKITGINLIKNTTGFFTLAQRLNEKNINITSRYFYFSQIQLMVDNKKFCEAIEKIHTEMNKLLNALKYIPAQYQITKKYSVLYFIECLNALEVFYSNPSPLVEDKNNLMNQLNQAEEHFCDNINDISTTASNLTVGSISKYVKRVALRLTAEMLSYPQYKTANSQLFFTKANKLAHIHHQILEEINIQESDQNQTKLQSNL